MNEHKNDDGLSEARNAGISMSGDGLTVGAAKYGSKKNSENTSEEHALEGWSRAGDTSRRAWLGSAGIPREQRAEYSNKHWADLPDNVRKALKSV